MTGLTLASRALQYRRLLLCLAWIVALGFAAGRYANARMSFRNLSRADKNNGHVTIDFGGQWLMGRMLATGHSAELYSRPRQWEIAEQAYDRNSEARDAKEHDAAIMLEWFMGVDDPRWLDFGRSAAAFVGTENPFAKAAIAIEAENGWTESHLQELAHPRKGVGIGGPLYPPIHCFIMLPYALCEHPQSGYLAAQLAQIFFCFLAGFGISRLSRGRIWWPVAAAIILVYPGCRAAIDLGQNSAMTLAILACGWTLLSRQRPVAGGVVWGLLAYKPVWALSFFLLLVLLRKRRSAFVMALTGACLAAATLPFVGLHSWIHWLSVGQIAAATYNLDQNWINLSRDLLSIPRRFLLDFALPKTERDRVLAVALCWALWALFVDAALRVYALLGRQAFPFVGPIPAFFVLTAWLCTFHFMYYDALLSVFGFFLILADPRPFFTPRFLEPAEGSSPRRRSTLILNSFVVTVLGLLLLAENTTAILKFEWTGVAHAFTSEKKLNDGATTVSPRLILGTSENYPVETLLVIATWVYCVGAAIKGARLSNDLPNAESDRLDYAAE